ARLSFSGTGSGVGLGPPPTPGGLVVWNYAGWLTQTANSMTANANLGAWGFLTAMQGNCWNLVSKPYFDTIRKAGTTGASLINPLGLSASAAWQELTANLPEGVTISWNLGAYVGVVLDFAAGVLDGLVGSTVRKAIFDAVGLGLLESWVGVD